MADGDVTLEELREWIWRWRNHYHRMLDQLEAKHSDPELIRRWRHEVDESFREKIRARL